MWFAGFNLNGGAPSEAAVAGSESLSRRDICQGRWMEVLWMEWWSGRREKCDRRAGHEVHSVGQAGRFCVV